MAVDYREIGERIQAIRREKGIKQAFLAEMMDVSTGYISQIETAKSKLSLEFLIKIAGVLERDPGYLINGTCTDSTEYKFMEIKDEIGTLSSKNRQLVYDFIKLLRRHEKQVIKNTKNDKNVIY